MDKKLSPFLIARKKAKSANEKNIGNWQKRRHSKGLLVKTVISFSTFFLIRCHVEFVLECFNEEITLTNLPLTHVQRSPHGSSPPAKP